MRTLNYQDKSKRLLINMDEPIAFFNSEEHDPSKNAKAISLIQQPDGNWKGYGNRFGKLIVVREMSPNDCLVKLLTHDGA